MSGDLPDKTLEAGAKKFTQAFGGPRGKKCLEMLEEAWAVDRCCMNARNELVDDRTLALLVGRRQAVTYIRRLVEIGRTAEE